VDIAEWLRGLGLGQYAQAFMENAIGWDVLPKLTADDLREIGITAVGDRRRLLEAIATLGDAGSRAAPEAAAQLLPRSLAGAAERRQLSVMFCDLVGSTALSLRFDLEDLRDLIAAYHSCVAETVARFDGFVAKYMGDGVLVYFGYPQAHEDDAERAVRAGLALTEAVGRLDSPQPLQARLGIATGLVVVGDLIGAGAAQERGVVGDTPNLAARLEALATPGTLVIADATRQQIGGLFELEDLGAQSLAGFAEPQPAWRVVAESGVVSRFEALRSGATPLIGRDEELELLQRRWGQAKGGEGRVVLVSGEPGIGKSRLSAEIARQIETEPHVRLRYFCAPHHQDSALYPFIVQLERAAEFAREDGAQDKRAKLEALLAPAARDPDEIELLAELLSLPNAADDLNLSPQRKREKLFEALLGQLEALTRVRPVLMLFEDAHWIDPTSRELMDLTVGRVARLPVLLVITFRPEFQLVWSGQPHVTVLALNRLGQRQVAALVLGLAGNTPLGSEVVEEIAERTDGVPLFVEELTKAVLERADQHNRVAAVLSASPLPALSVPATLHASLIARLDRIGPAAKEVAQIGAVLGRSFSYELIRHLAPRPDLDASLAQLTEAGLLFCRGVPPQSSYLFKHALVQDAAYGTLLRSRRRELHARVAAVLEKRFADLVERQPELLAHHLTGAGATAPAIDQWLKAGQFAAVRSAHTEAISHFDRGLALLASLAETTQRDRQEIELQLAKGPSLLAAKGFQSPEAVATYERARSLCEKCGDAEHLFAALWNLWLTTGIRDIDAARPLSNRLLLLTEQTTNTALRLEAHHCALRTDFCVGELEPAREHCDEGRRLYDFEQHRGLAHLYGGHDPGVCARQHGGLIEWLLGYPDKAVESLREAVLLAERLHHPFSISHALHFDAVLRLFRREPDQAFQRADDAAVLAAEQRVSPILDSNILRAAALLAQDATEPATASVRAGLAARQGWVLAHQYQMTLAAEVLHRAGDLDGAWAALTEAEAAGKAERWWEPEIHRLKGLLLLSRGNLIESEACFERAMRIAQRQGAKSLELRAAVSLARLCGEQGRRRKAQELLAPVYGWFTEGFDTADLKEAAALLDSLA
jgi:class 3 adenylate cyclase